MKRFLSLLRASVWFVAALAPSYGSAATGAVLSPVEATLWQADLRHMADEVTRWHKQAFHTVSRAEFDASIATLDAKIPSISRHQVIVEMARIVATIGDGHTSISPTRDPKIAFRTYPIKLYYFSDGLFIRSATTSFTGLIGGRITAIGDTPIDMVYAKVRDIIGRDNEMGAQFFAPHLMSMPEVLHALGIIADMNRAAFTIVQDGKIARVTLGPFGLAKMMCPDTDASWIAEDGWVDARTANNTSAFWLGDPLNKFRLEYLADKQAIYAQINEIGNKTDETVEAFSRRLLEFVDRHDAEKLVVDLRLNRGGNGKLNRYLISSIIKARKLDQPRKLFVLIGRSTFSAAQFLVNDLEWLTNATFVGEPSGSKSNIYGDSRRIVLPNSGITVRVSTLWWQVDERDQRQWTSPHVQALLTFDDYKNNRDPALQTALDY